MVYFRLSAMSLTAAVVLAVFVVLPSLPQHSQGHDPDLVRAYATYRRILVETGVIAGVKVEGDRLLVTPGSRWYELSEEMRQLHAHVLAEGLLGNRDAPCTIESPGQLQHSGTPAPGVPSGCQARGLAAPAYPIVRSGKHSCKAAGN